MQIQKLELFLWVLTILTDPTYLEYMKDGVIYSSIEKPITIQRLCQRVSDELNQDQNPKA